MMHALSHIVTKKDTFLGKLDRLKHTNRGLEMEFCGCCSRTLFQPLCSQAVALPGIVVIQGQDPALGLVDSHATGHESSLSRSLWREFLPSSTGTFQPHPMVFGGKSSPLEQSPGKRMCEKVKHRKGFLLL